MTVCKEDTMDLHRRPKRTRLTLSLPWWRLLVLLVVVKMVGKVVNFEEEEEEEGRSRVA